MSSLERGEGAKTIREGNTERKGGEKENDRERGGGGETKGERHRDRQTSGGGMIIKVQQNLKQRKKNIICAALYFSLKYY